MAILFVAMNTQAQVAVNTDGSPADASAMLDVKATDAGMLVPRMSSTAMNNIVNPATSLFVYNTTANAFYYFDGNNWVSLGSISDGDWNLDGNDMYSAVSGNVAIGYTPPGTVGPAAKLSIGGNGEIGALSVTGSGVGNIAVFRDIDGEDILGIMGSQGNQDYQTAHTALINQVFQSLSRLFPDKFQVRGNRTLIQPPRESRHTEAQCPF